MGFEKWVQMLMRNNIRTLLRTRHQHNMPRGFLGRRRLVSNTDRFDMNHIFGFERSQLLLLPEAVDDYVGADNPVRFIDAFVDQLDLAAAGFIRVAPRATGPAAARKKFPYRRDLT